MYQGTKELRAKEEVYFTESKEHRTAEVRRDLWRFLVQPHYSKQGHLEQAAESSWVLNIATEGDSTASLTNLCQH